MACTHKYKNYEHFYELHNMYTLNTLTFSSWQKLHSHFVIQVVWLVLTLSYTYSPLAWFDLSDGGMEVKRWREQRQGPGAPGVRKKRSRLTRTGRDMNGWWPLAGSLCGGEARSRADGAQHRIICNKQTDNRIKTLLLLT